MADEYISVLIKKLLYLVWVPHISLEGKCKVQRSMREINGGITPALHIYIQSCAINVGLDSKSNIC